MDGDINKAFQGLNDLESRTPPSVTGNSGKFLTNNGTATSWGLVTSSGMSSVSATAGYVLQANGIGGVGYGTISPSALAGSGVTAGTYAFPNLTIAASGIVTSAVTNTVAFISGSALVGSSVSFTTITATTISVTNISASTLDGVAISNTIIPKALVNFAAATGTVSASYNISTVSRRGTGVYDISFSTPMSTTNYYPVVTWRNLTSTAIACGAYGTNLPTTTGFTIGCYNPSTGGVNDPQGVYAVVFGN